jgi:hypothetical protein
MFFKFTCEKCRSVLEADAVQQGTQLECPRCAAVLTIPRAAIGPGATIGGFEIKKLLGRGGMGEVYLAHQTTMSRDVALKILSPALTVDPEQVQRFLHEVRLTAKLEHPSLVTAHEAGEDNGVYFMAMSYVRGQSLEDRLIKEGAMKEREALALARKVALALRWACEEHHLLHRDIKPSNILLDHHGEPKLTDLGLSKSLVEPGLTVSSHVMGTPNYMSPEQAEGRLDLDLRADVYSLGATMHHMLTGKVPFGGTGVVEVLRKQITEPLPDPRKFNPEISEHCVQLLEIMLAKNRDKRHASWEAVIGDIDRVMAGVATSLVPLAAGESLLMRGKPDKAQDHKIRLRESQVQKLAAWQREQAHHVAPEKRGVPVAVSVAVGLFLLVGVSIGVLMTKSGREKPRAGRPAPASPPRAASAVTPAPAAMRPATPAGAGHALYGQWSSNLQDPNAKRRVYGSSGEAINMDGDQVTARGRITVVDGKTLRVDFASGVDVVRLVDDDTATVDFQWLDGRTQHSTIHREPSARVAGLNFTPTREQYVGRWFRFDGWQSRIVDLRADGTAAAYVDGDIHPGYAKGAIWQYQDGGVQTWSGNETRDALRLTAPDQMRFNGRPAIRTNLDPLGLPGGEKIGFQASRDQYVGCWEFEYQGHRVRRELNSDGAAELLADGQKSDLDLTWAITNGRAFLRLPANSFYGAAAHGGCVLKDPDTMLIPGSPFPPARRVSSPQGAPKLVSATEVIDTDGFRIRQWPVTEGGNGHWYKAVRKAYSWSDANAAATAAGGYLATITSAAENKFVFDRLEIRQLQQASGPGFTHGCLLGALRDNNATNKAMGWKWVTGEPWAYANWSSQQPDGGGGTNLVENRLGFGNSGATLDGTWNDFPARQALPYVVEWDKPPPAVREALAAGQAGGSRPVATAGLDADLYGEALNSVADTFLRADVAGARAALAKIKDQSVLSAEQRAEAASLLETIDKVADMPSAILNGFKDDIGKEIAIDLKSGPVSLQVDGVDKAVIRAHKVVKAEGRVVGQSERNVAYAELSVKEKAKRLGSKTEGEYGLMKGLLSLEAQSPESAQAMFVRSGDPWGELLAGRLRETKVQRRVAVESRDEARQQEAARTAYANLLTVARVKTSGAVDESLAADILSKKYSDREYETLKRYYEKFQQDFGETAVAREHSLVLSTLRALRPPGPVKVDKAAMNDAVEAMKKATPFLKPTVNVTSEGVEFLAAGGLIKDLTPLKGIPLFKLDIQRSLVGDLSPLAGMPLRFLNIYNCPVLDLGPLSGMPLTNLVLGGSPCLVTDLTPLKGLPLTSLTIIETGRIRDFSPLRGMRLTLLNLSSCSGVDDLSLLEGMPLTSLHINGCTRVKDLTPLAKLPIRQLYMDGVVPKDFAPLRGMPLEVLSLKYNAGTPDPELLKQIKTLREVVR